MSNWKIFLFGAIFVSLLFLAGCTLFGGGTPSTVPIVGTPPEPARNTDGAETKAIPGGSYILGSSTSDTMALSHEQPQHKLELTGFNIYIHEVTNSMYKKCADAGACTPVTDLRQDLTDYYTGDAYKDFPVVGVDWNMAKVYCEWAGGRLPTEAEWEATARGIDERVYPWGNDPATCANNAMKGCGKQSLPFQVGSFAAGNSPFQVWDMAGNVWEWTNDWYDANYYATDPTNNPMGPWSGQFKVIRGGGWNSTNDKVRTANRFAVEPTLSFRDVGFRCVANPFPTTHSISIPDGGHTVCHAAGGVEDGGGTCPAGDAYWGSPDAICGSGDSIVIQLPARNTFGGTYIATLDDHPMTCVYSSGILTCRITRFAASGAYYAFSAITTDPSGGMLYIYNTGIRASTFDSCSGTRIPLAFHTETASCIHPPEPGRVLSLNVSEGIRLDQISLNDTPLVHCTLIDPFHISCPVPAETGAGPATVHVTGTLLDGVTPVDFTGSVGVPDCTYPPVSGEATFNASATCTDAGRYVVDIRFTPADANVTSVLYSGPVRARCLMPDFGHIICDAGPENAVTVFTGQAIPIFLNFNPPISMGGSSDVSTVPLIVDAPTCTGSNNPGGLQVTGADCSPTGSGLVIHVFASPSSGTTAVMWQSVGVQHACSATPTVPVSWECNLPTIPIDLEICSTNASGTTCTPHPEVAVMAPTRCGGSSGNEVWNFAVDCLNHDSDDLLVINVGLTGGAIPVDIKGGYRTTTWYGTANPAMPNFFQMTVPRSFITLDLGFIATFADSTQLNHTENLASLAPASCKLDQGTGTGGVCADIPSASGWQNPTNQYDVNNDGCVTSLDVSIVMANLGRSPLASPRPAGSAFVDVSGDGAVTSLDAQMVMQYINDHPGSTCTPTCTTGGGPSSSGEWTLEVICNPANQRPGITIEFRAHIPGETANIIGAGRSYLGCDFGGNPVVTSTISQFCPPGMLFDAPMIFWVRRTDGTIDSHTFDNPGALLASPCPSSRAAPDVKVIASCSTSYAGAYDLDIVYSPPSFNIYSIYDEAGHVLTSCGVCTNGHCHCTGVPASADGLIHINVDDRNGPEIMYPQTVVPPVCSNNPQGDWGMNAVCNNDGTITLQITPPASLHLTQPAVSIPGDWGYSTSSTGFNFYLPSGYVPPSSVTLEFLGPEPDYTPVFHTFTGFASVIPTSCATQGGLNLKPVPHCVGNAAVVDFYGNPGDSITLNTLNGAPILPTDISNNGTSLVTSMVPDSVQGTAVNFGLDFQPSGGSSTSGTVSVMIPTCGNTSTGWTLGTPVCVSAGWNVEFNVDHLADLAITSASCSTSGATYPCGINTPTRLYCTGPAVPAPGILTLDYTVTGGATGSVSFDNWASIVPRYCATPMPPHIKTCEEQTNQGNCEADPSMGCKWNGTSCYHP